MKSVLMTADAVGGVWRYSVDLGRALQSRGFAATMAVMGPAPTDAQVREATQAGIAVVHAPYPLIPGSQANWEADSPTD